MLIVSLKNAVDEIEFVMVNGKEILFSDLTLDQIDLITKILENYKSSFHILELSGNIVINKNELAQEIFSKPSSLISYNDLAIDEKIIIDNLVNKFL